MRCQPIRCSNEIPPFRAKSNLKTQWLKGNLGSVTRGIYGDILTPETVSQEHLLPRSLGGKTYQRNLALATKKMNCKRGNQPLSLFLTDEMIDSYCNQFVDVKAGDFDGNSYIKAIKRTIRHIFRKEQNNVN